LVDRQRVELALADHQHLAACGPEVPTVQELRNLARVPEDRELLAGEPELLPHYLAIEIPVVGYLYRLPLVVSDAVPPLAARLLLQLPLIQRLVLDGDQARA
jgi:hypothetical protein